MVRLPTRRPSLSATGFRPDLVHGGDRAGAFDRFRGRICGHAPGGLRDANETWLVFGESPHGEGHGFRPRGPLPRLRMRVSDSPGQPRRDLLDYPRIVVRIVEGEEGSVARALGVGTAEPRLRGKRGPVPHLTRIDATANEFVAGRFDVGDDQCPLGRARRAGNYSLAEGDGAP